MLYNKREFRLFLNLCGISIILKCGLLFLVKVSGRLFRTLNNCMRINTPGGLRLMFVQIDLHFESLDKKKREYYKTMKRCDIIQNNKFSNRK